MVSASFRKCRELGGLDMRGTGLAWQGQSKAIRPRSRLEPSFDRLLPVDLAIRQYEKVLAFSSAC